MKQPLPDISPKGDREAILARVAEALREEAPRYHEAPQKPAPKGVTAPFREWLPPVGNTRKDQIALFAKQSEALRTEFCECASAAAAAKHIAALAKKSHWKTIALHTGELTDAIAEKLPDTLTLLRINHGYKKEDLEACDAGLTECESLIAQTGSVCVTGRSSGGRALSVLPPHHIVIAHAEQLLPDLPAAYEALARKCPRQECPGFMSFITGPSRTGDIERILVLGAHGPKKLTVLLIRSAAAVDSWRMVKVAIIASGGTSDNCQNRSCLMSAAQRFVRDARPRRATRPDEPTAFSGIESDDFVTATPATGPRS